MSNIIHEALTTCKTPLPEDDLAKPVLENISKFISQYGVYLTSNNSISIKLSVTNAHEQTKITLKAPDSSYFNFTICFFSELGITAICNLLKNTNNATFEPLHNENTQFFDYYLITFPIPE